MLAETTAFAKAHRRTVMVILAFILNECFHVKYAHKGIHYVVRVSVSKKRKSYT